MIRSKLQKAIGQIDVSDNNYHENMNTLWYESIKVGLDLWLDQNYKKQLVKLMFQIIIIMRIWIHSDMNQGPVI